VSNNQNCFGNHRALEVNMEQKKKKKKSNPSSLFGRFLRIDKLLEDISVQIPVRMFILQELKRSSPHTAQPTS